MSSSPIIQYPPVSTLNFIPSEGALPPLVKRSPLKESNEKSFMASFPLMYKFEMSNGANAITPTIDRGTISIKRIIIADLFFLLNFNSFSGFFNVFHLY